jgi:hypothetical protein
LEVKCATKAIGALRHSVLEGSKKLLHKRKTDMSNDWLEWLKNRVFRLHRWHPISTAPFNQELELRIAENDQIVTLEYPCLQTNEGFWINVDLGTQIRVTAVEWRAWHHSKSPEAHHLKTRPADRRAITHPDHGRVKHDDDNMGPDITP